MSEGAGLPGGYLVGHWTDERAETGCTVIVPPAGARCGVDVRGGGPGTRESDVVGPMANPQEATAVLLTGGSAYGLAAADGVVRWCEREGRGYATPGGIVPLVPAAVVYDLATGDPSVRPGAEEGFAACEAAREGRPQTGRIGAGTGAAVGKVLGRERSSPGGVGFAAAKLGSGERVAAIAVVNATGDVVGADGTIVAGVRDPDGRTSAEIVTGLERVAGWGAEEDRQATTLTCILTDAALDKLDCAKLARMASAGTARAIDPVFSPFDGDVTFTLASGAVSGQRSPGLLVAVGTLGASLAAEAIRDAVAPPGP